jgi:hypothetical protein
MVICVDTAFYNKVPDNQMIIGTLIVSGTVVMLPLVDKIEAYCIKTNREDDSGIPVIVSDSRLIFKHQSINK